MNLSDPAQLRSFLSRRGLAPQKGLGQHFLCSASAVEAIVSRFEGFGGVLEIGPGPGVLTGPLVERVGRVTALELDTGMIDALSESAPGADVRSEDALKADLPSILSELPEPRGVVSNLPYYITGALVQVVANAHRCFDRAVLMMQREVGERVLAEPGDRRRGSLSVFLQARFDIRKVCSVPAGAFVPPPKIDSVVLEFNPLGSGHEEAFFGFVRAGFSQPRKTLANNLAGSGVAGKSEVEAALAAAGHPAGVRAHMLTLAGWEAAFRALRGGPC